MRIASLMLFAVLPIPAMAQSSPIVSPLQRCLTSEAARADLTGTILAVRRGVIVASVYRGRLAGADSPPISRNTRFNLGSASKMFTAVAIGQLIDAGKLRLDQPVGEIVSGLTSEAAKVTIRQLLTHSSGLGDFFRPENMNAMLKARTASDILPLIASDRPVFPPGSRFAYSNTGFALLGIVVERASGMHYGQYLAEHIFKPAGMTNTGLDPQPLASLAVGMTKGAMHGRTGESGTLMLVGPDGKSRSPGATQSGRPGGLVLIDPEQRTVSPPEGNPADAPLFAAPGATEGYGSPAGGLFSTGEDMRRFATALMQNKLLSRATTMQFTSPQIESAPAAEARPARYYGFGFGISDEGGRRWIGHNGGTLGANAEFAIQPEDQWVISVLSNRDPPAATILMRRIKALVADPALMTSCR